MRGQCPTCGRRFEKRSPKKYQPKYCSQKCAYIGLSKRKRRCIECGKFFVNTSLENDGLCSTRCRYRKLVYDHYGRACACCGESIPEMLTIDHIAEDGAKHRKEIGGGGVIYSWLVKQYKNQGQWPAGFQILCRNCNYAKMRDGETCPHERQAGFVRFDMMDWGDEGPEYEVWDP